MSNIENLILDENFVLEMHFSDLELSKYVSKNKTLIDSFPSFI